MAMYEVWAQIIDSDAAEICEGKRTGLRAAFAFARKLWREYRGAAKISVRLDGVVIEDEISEMSLSLRKWHVGERRGLGK